MVLGSGAAVAALYVTDGAGFRYQAGHALDTAVKPWFARGEGLIGEAGTRSKIVHVQDVPRDYLKIESASGSRDAVEIVLVPACVEGVPFAVVELGFLGAVPPRAMELFDRVSETVAIALRTAEQKTRLRDLLEESQRQAEELQAQQEELRAANDELSQQSEALREAHAQLEERREKLESSNVSLAHQRDVLEAARRQLTTKAAEVEQASRYKSEFLANMSHELRTPLNSSLILAKLLADNKDGNLTPEQVKFASTIYSAGNDLLSLINDILDLSKVEAGKLQVYPSPVTLARLVDPLRRTFEPLAKEKGLAFRFQVDAPQATLETDIGRAQQILKNLLANAFKFTEAGEVILGASCAEDTFTLSVRDTGVGIPEDQREAIFEAFVQVEGTSSRRFGGTGLGLPSRAISPDSSGASCGSRARWARGASSC